MNCEIIGLFIPFRLSDSLLGKISRTCIMSQEFLPLCDVLFNIISMASYFCDVVFDVITAYTLYQQEQYVWLSMAVFFIGSSLIVSQFLSAKWFLQRHSSCQSTITATTNDDRGKEDSEQVNKGSLVAMHLMGMGVLWRYFKLFIPVDLRIVKHEVRDLCMLRLTHAFIEAAPMLLVQLYLIWLKPSRNDVQDLNIVSTVLSLVSVCWALASFNKNVRRQNVHKLVLTWLGVIFQFLWRLGTVTSRVVALTVYATVYNYWVFLVIGLHWMSMFFWLISPRNVFHGDKMSKLKKDAYCALIAVVYVFCYVNLQHVNPRMKMAAFYVTMFLENTLLVAVWLIGVHRNEPWYHELATVVMFLSFFVGIIFLGLYYRYFHVKRLNYGSSSSAYATNNNPPEPYTYVTPSGTYMDHGSDPNGAAKNVNAVSYFLNKECANSSFIYLFISLGYVRQAERSYGLLHREHTVCSRCVQLPIQSSHDEEEKETDYFRTATRARNAVHVGRWRW